MIVCPNCFDDIGLRNEIIPQFSSERGTCPTCNSLDQHLIEADRLSNYFEVLIGIYVQSEDGAPLSQLLNDDWGIFSQSKISPPHAKEILAEILNDGEIVRKNFSISARCKSESAARWEQLKLELMHQNRFFPVTEFRKDWLEKILRYLVVKSDNLPPDWFRARIETNGAPYPATEMGAPPPKKASHGRANPAGIPYLYLASETETAAAEVRPHPGERVCIGKFHTKENLDFIDLRNPKSSISPFILDEEGDLELLRGQTDLLRILGEELSTPVVPMDVAFNYIPTQYLCELIKKFGYDGVIYNSSMGGGINLAIFDPEKADIDGVHEIDITGITLDMSAA
ncbi:RES domain-containing protein [Phaeobacter inhibens]|uniref:RES family NAD+ phosphorylase n=1 Tax=Phaeobacter inhibens TaxID=221822 RepID=UPI000274B517|nr:RES family NAD+ phosphorylase [Phaeobacter inhibens]AFO87174.1 hypothetical protein PGA2_c11670 [Phaeobacter inhibens 2.10]AXT41978.1 RES domain-containing protein [Phaeobacter inhibens]